MKPALYQIRECRNPNCGLRYPILQGAPFGNRCPRCLGDTIVVLEGGLASSQAPNIAGAPAVRTLRPLLDNVRSAFNVGSILRTAEGLGLSHIYLAGITPTPEEAQVQKTSLGAESQLAWSHHANGLELLSTLRDEGYKIWALENVPEAIPLDAHDVSWARGVEAVMVVGNEVTGVDPGILQAADRIMCISMSGRKTSFNTAVAFAIAAYVLTTARP